MMHGQGAARNGSAHAGEPLHSGEWGGPAIRSSYSCRNQTVPSGGAATVAENGWPCHGSSTASTPP